jgi:mannose-1-phosphate guanylyltransferase
MKANKIIHSPKKQSNDPSTITTAVLLSAGFGTRLRPITDTIPKCLVPINGKPLLQIWLEQLTNIGINQFIINSHYLAEKVTEFVEQSAFREQVTIFHEPELLGTLGTLKATQQHWQNKNFLVAHADNLCFASWPAFFERFHQRPKNCLGTMMLFESDNPKSCGVVTLDEQQRLLKFFEKVDKPPTNLANAAIYLFDKHLAPFINQLPKGASDISLDLMPKLLGKMNTWLNDGYLRDIGNPESLAIAEQYVASLNRKSD